MLHHYHTPIPIILKIIVVVFALPLTQGTFCPEFHKFLRLNYGHKVADWLTRMDLGQNGSFGGCANQFGIKFRPVIYIHGLSLTANDMKPSAEFFIANGNGAYSWANVFATTYANGLIAAHLDSMLCEHVQRIRLLIDAVIQFTGFSTVDIIAYSMGCPLVRKAIIGGRCVDTSEQLGSSLGERVNNLLCIGGANYAARWLCPPELLSLKQPAPLMTPCNAVTGMVCRSKFLVDVNRHNSLGILGTGSVIIARYDQIVGYRVCPTDFGPYTSLFPGWNINVNIDIPGYGHFLAFYATFQIQLMLITGQPIPRSNPIQLITPPSEFNSTFRDAVIEATNLVASEAYATLGLPKVRLPTFGL